MYSHPHPHPHPQQQGPTSVDAYPWTYDQHQQQNGTQHTPYHSHPHTSGPTAASASHHALAAPPLPDYRSQAHDPFAHYSLNPSPSHNHNHNHTHNHNPPHPSSGSNPASANATPTSQHQTPGTKYAEAPFYPFGDLEPPHSSALHLSVPPINPFDDIHSGFGAMPSPGVVPPLPIDMGHALSDAALAQLDHPNPFSLVDVGPHSSVGWPNGGATGGVQNVDRGQGASASASTSTSTNTNNNTNTNVNPSANGDTNANSNPFKFDHYEVLATLLSTRPDAAQAQAQMQTPGSEGPPFDFHTGQSTPTTAMSPGMGSMSMSLNPSSGSGMGGTGRKGKERTGEWHMDLGRDLKRVRAEGHNEFDKDIALLQTYLTELVGLLQPFAITPTHTSPQKPPPFLHTRFLRLTSSVEQTLANLAPASHTYLSSDFTSAPPGDGKGDAKPPTKAEKEMEIIRKRRDMLIAKAAQAKATQAAQALAGGFNPSAASNVRGKTSTSSSASPGIFHPTIPMPHVPPPLHAYPNVSSGLASYAMDANGNGSRGMNGSGGDMGYGGLGRPAPIHPDNPTGRCHSCGISVTMEWRKGPDGARTLCDSCGTHYAKLARRRSSASPSKIPASLFG